MVKYAHCFRKYPTLGECVTVEDIARNINGIPINAFYGYEIYPLADFNETVQSMLERLKEAEKMMPAPAK